MYYMDLQITGISTVRQYLGTISINIKTSEIAIVNKIFMTVLSI